MHHISPKMREELRKDIGVDRLEFFIIDKVPCVTIIEKPRYKIVAIKTSIDLSPWFANRECAKSWKSFHRCMNEKRNEKDEMLYRRLDRMFVSRILCQEGQKCESDFLRWEFHWYSPHFMELQTYIGKGGFVSVKEAKKSLAHINALLKKVLYGAKFPESLDESRDESLYYETKVLINDYRKHLIKLLVKLKKLHLVTGLQKSDIEHIGSLAHPGGFILYIPSGCPSPYPRGGSGKWIDVGVAHIQFGKCPRIEILR